MQEPKEVLRIFEKYTPLVDGEIKELLLEQDSLLMYDMMRYFFGYLDGDLKEVASYGGKRFRPGLTLLCSNFYNKEKEALGVASAIEIFHNFTLIHDDIEDNDPIRRGKETVWKKWGVNHGINTGDTQLILAFKELNKRYSNKPEILAKLNNFLADIFQGVAEGQFMDFTLAESYLGDPKVTEETYLEMIKRKSAILVAASAKVAGIIAETDTTTIDNLWNYGLHLGYAYQLNDDLLSIWGESKSTGKAEAKDIQERKKTLPIIYLYSKLTGSEKERFSFLYNKSELLTNEEITEIKGLLNQNGALDYVLANIAKHLEEAKEAIAGLSVDEKNKELLIDINKALIPKFERKQK